jgi:hypothetical protein
VLSPLVVGGKASEAAAEFGAGYGSRDDIAAYPAASEPRSPSAISTATGTARSSRVRPEARAAVFYCSNALGGKATGGRGQ